MDNLEFAWLEAGEKLYFTSCTRQESELLGHSPVIKLIEQIYHTESFHSPSQARRILRERIYYSSGLSITDRETVKVTAKRLRPSVDPLPMELKNQLPENQSQLKSLPALEFFSDEQLVVGNTLHAAEIPEALERLRQSSNQSVSALLVDKDDRILAWSWNTNSVIKTRHAEWNLCERLGRKIPSGARIWVSLKPCRMCAARIWEQAEDPSQIEVIFIENDPGPLAQGTMLDADSAARIRYLGARDARRNLQIQRQLNYSAS